MAIEERLSERMAKIEGAFAQVTERLNRIENDLRGKADKWEIRIWFLTLIILITIFQFLG